jgi:hypothetical protein
MNSKQPFWFSSIISLMKSGAEDFGLYWPETQYDHLFKSLSFPIEGMMAEGREG